MQVKAPERANAALQARTGDLHGQHRTDPEKGESLSHLFAHHTWTLRRHLLLRAALHSPRKPVPVDAQRAGRRQPAKENIRQSRSLCTRVRDKPRTEAGLHRRRHLDPRGREPAHHAGYVLQRGGTGGFASVLLPQAYPAWREPTPSNSWG